LRAKRLSLADAKAQAAEWEARRRQHERDNALAARFQDSSAGDVITMWETGKNEQGRMLSQFEFGALVERWCELFGTLPPDDAEELNGIAGDQSTNKAEPEPEDDTMLRIGEVIRLTGISGSTIKRMVVDGRFPKPLRLSPRRIGWQARDVKAWVRQLEDQRRAPRQ
jgi:prophage regulatory protein